MRIRYKLIIYSFILVFLSGCIKEEAILEGAQYELMARMETDADTKTSLSGLQDGKYYPLWSAGDEIAVFMDGDNEYEKFTLKDGAGTTEASFTGVVGGESYYAVYPLNAAGIMQNGEILLTLPQKQQYVIGSFGQGAYPMIGKGSDGSIDFKNLCAVMKISIKGQGEIRSITLTAKDTTAYMSGPATVVADYGKEPELKMKDGGSNYVELECGNVVLSKDSITDFHIVIPAQTYKGGFELSIDAYTTVVKKDITSDLEFKRSQIRHLKGLELNLEMTERELLLAKERRALIDLYYATDGDNWKDNTNWCSDKPVGDWNGIQTNREGWVISISLSNNNLNGTIPASIGNLTKLERLAVTYNNLTGHIPESIGKLINLKYLLLSVNNLSGTLDIITNNLVNLKSLWLGENNFKGKIPENIVNLSNLQTLELSKCNLSGMIPSGIGELTKLSSLKLGDNNLTGTIPESITNLNSLKTLMLHRNYLSGEIPNGISALTEIEEMWLQGNGLSGTIPEEMVSLNNLKKLYLFHNKLSGKIPDSFYDWSLWKSYWGYSVIGNNYNFKDLRLPGPAATIRTFSGQSIDLESEYKNYRYTILHGWCEDYASKSILPQLNSIYDLYHDKGIRIIGWPLASKYTEEEAIEYIKKTGMKWDNFYYNNKENTNTFGVHCYPTSWVTSVTVVDSTGRIVFSDIFDDSIYTQDEYFKKLLEHDFNITDNEDNDYYVSTDYSQDGTVVQMQKASEGKGINIVIMGDGYTDKLIADGTYRADMEYVYSKLFIKEPYKSYINRFNVSYINVVSPTEGVRGTALDCGFGEGTHVFGNDKKCFGYAQNAVDVEDMDETLVVVVLNSNRYAGTCYMYYPTNSGTDYGKGAAVAYFPKGRDAETFAELLHHEACGHGFTKLADEYFYEKNGIIPSSEVVKLKNQQSLYGWWKNVDFTNDPAQVRWKKFLEDSRYANEGLGVFEGGDTYWSGV